jgi:hypothetical protein
LTAAVERAASFGEQRRSYLDARAGRGCSAESTNEQRKWASRVQAIKGLGREEVSRKCADVGASTTRVCGREVRDEGPDGWGPRGREGMSACARGSAPTSLAHLAAGGRESVRARTRAVAGMWGPLVKQRGRTRGLAGLNWPFLFL